MKLSIITVCYNQPDIEDTCASVAAQTWRDFEWLVVDGGSTDGTVEILGKYRSFMSSFISERDSGIYNAMNKGMALARGEWVLFLNGGDSLFDRHALERVFSAAFPGDEADVVYGDLAVAYPSGEIATETYPSRRVTKAYFFNHVIPHPASFIRRELFERFSGYDESFRAAADWEKWIVFAEGGCRFRKMDVLVSCFKKDGLSSDRRQRELLARERAAILDRHFDADARADGMSGEVREKEYVTLYRLDLFGALPVVTIRETRNGEKRATRILGLPFLKRRRRNGTMRTMLFGFVPIPRIEDGGGLNPEFLHVGRGGAI